MNNGLEQWSPPITFTEDLFASALAWGYYDWLLMVERQKQIGRYYADFALYVKSGVNQVAQIVVEIDGKSHDDNWFHDTVRSVVLHKAGWKVLRFRDHEICSNVRGCIMEIGRVVLDWQRWFLEDPGWNNPWICEWDQNYTPFHSRPESILLARRLRREA